MNNNNKQNPFWLQQRKLDQELGSAQPIDTGDYNSTATKYSQKRYVCS